MAQMLDTYDICSIDSGSHYLHSDLIILLYHYVLAKSIHKMYSYCSLAVPYLYRGICVMWSHMVKLPLPCPIE